MKNTEFIELLKTTAKEQSSLSQETLIPSQLSGLADFVALHLWQSVLCLALLSTVFLQLST